MPFSLQLNTNARKANQTAWAGPWSLQLACDLTPLRPWRDVSSPACWLTTPPCPLCIRQNTTQPPKWFLILVLRHRRELTHHFHSIVSSVCVASCSRHSTQGLTVQRITLNEGWTFSADRPNNLDPLTESKQWWLPGTNELTSLSWSRSACTESELCQHLCVWLLHRSHWALSVSVFTCCPEFP